MTYVVHFLRIEPGTHWVDALEAQELEQERNRLSRVASGDDSMVDIVRPDWWRIASLLYRVLPAAELRRTKQGLTFVDRATGIVLSLEVDEYTLSLPFRHDERRARDVLSIAQRLAQFVEEETGLVAFDAQLGQPFLGVDGSLDHGAALIASTRRALTEKAMVRPRIGHMDVGASRPRIR
ncbi:MAG: hypothetical protein R3F49_14080 [Planctomycetota bacterium]